jgi:glycosyltransferase involved in cell wall biosynthesis
MRVLINGLQAGNRSGTGVYTQRLVEWLPRVAGDLEFAVLWPEGMEPPAGMEHVFRAGGLGRLLTDQWGIRAERQRLRADLVHYPASVGNVIGLPGTVLTVHDLSFMVEPQWFRAGRAAYYRLAVARSARTAARIVADSEATAADLRERLRLPADRIDVVPLGVDESLAPAAPEQCREARLRYGLPEHYLLFLGTLEPRKNVSRIVRAWSRAVDVDKDMPDLVLAGRYGWKVEPILHEVMESPHFARIHLPGFIAREDAPAVMTAAEGFVWPSLYEGFGLPPLEAMACGAPVLTSNTSSLPEAVGDAALTIDPEDESALTEAIHRLVTDAPLRETLRAKGLARVKEFTWRRTAERSAETYRKTLG